MPMPSTRPIAPPAAMLRFGVGATCGAWSAGLASLLAPGSDARCAAMRLERRSARSQLRAVDVGLACRSDASWPSACRALICAFNLESYRGRRSRRSAARAASSRLVPGGVDAALREGDRVAVRQPHRDIACRAVDGEVDDVRVRVGRDLGVVEHVLAGPDLLLGRAEQPGAGALPRRRPAAARPSASCRARPAACSSLQSPVGAAVSPFAAASCSRRTAGWHRSRRRRRHRGSARAPPAWR